MSSTSIVNTGLTHPTDVFTRGPNYCNLSSFGVSSAVTIVIPTGAQFVRLSGSVDFFVRFGSTAVSTAIASDGTGSEFVPVQSGGILRSIGSTLGTTAISVMSTAGGNLGQSWWTV